jgi:hydrogenase nickel incorporation protein HypA/HybF
MHELSIAEAVLAVALEHAQGRRIVRVELSVGELRQVVPDALSFAFELVAADTDAEGAELVISHVSATGDCRTCGARTRLRAFPLQCERCGGLDVEIAGGEELCVEAIDVEPVLEEVR